MEQPWYEVGRLIWVLQRRCRRQISVLTTGTLPPSSITAGMATWRGVLRLKWSNSSVSRPMGTPNISNRHIRNDNWNTSMLVSSTKIGMDYFILGPIAVCVCVSDVMRIDFRFQISVYFLFSVFPFEISISRFGIECVRRAGIYSTNLADTGRA